MALHTKTVSSLVNDEVTQMHVTTIHASVYIANKLHFEGLTFIISVAYVYRMKELVVFM